jgi:hypothetical protein
VGTIDRCPFTPIGVQHAFYRKLFLVLFGVWLAQLASTFGVVFGTVRACSAACVRVCAYACVRVCRSRH